MAQEPLQGTFSRRHINTFEALEARRMAYASFWSIFGVLEGVSGLALAASVAPERLYVT